MNRALYLTMSEGTVVAQCLAEDVGISAIERLPAGGVRLVCKSVDGAERMRGKFKKHLIDGPVVRERHRPTRPLW